MSIQAIDQSSIHSLTSGQVVIDLQTAVKELVENALDAGATSIDVKFKEHGVESIEVQDNGKGIEKDDWPGIALKHHTSKLSSFADLTSVSTLGFRGEALSSLCGTANLSLVTSTATTAPVGTSLTFIRSGECVIGGKVARSKGTTIKIERLFELLPVRRKELIKNAKREFAKALELLQAYALISTGVRFEVKNTTKSKTMTHLQSPAASTLRSNFSSIFAPKSLQSMLELDLDLEVEADKSVLRWTEGSASPTGVIVEGLVSKPSAGNGRTSGNRQFFYINGRPFHPSKIAKAVNEVYRSFVPGSFPTVVADFQLASDAYDVNVSPDKRTIFLHSEGNLVAALKSALEEFFQRSQSTFQMTQIGDADKSSKDLATATPKRSESSPKPSGTDDRNDAEGGEDEERPKKRKKIEHSEETQDGPILAEEATTVARSSPYDTEGDFLDMEVDAGLFAATQDFVLPPEFQAAVDSDRPLDLPTPPSPIRHAAALRASQSSTSSPPRTASNPPSPLQASRRADSGFDAVPSTTQTSPVLPTSTSLETKSTPLFRASPSPTPIPADSGASSPSPHRHSPSRSPTPPPSARAISSSTNLRQPQLTFEPGGFDKTLETRRDRKGKGKAADQNGLQSMRNLLRNFVKPGTDTESQKRPDPLEDLGSDDEESEEIQDEEGEGVDSYGSRGVDERSRPAKSKPRRRSEEASADEPTKVLADRQSSEQEEHEDEDDELEVVEGSFLLPHASEPDIEQDEDEDELEVLESSCVCVHGSPADAGEPSKDSAPRPAISTSAASQIETLFGGAPAEVAGTFIAADTTLDFDLSALETAWSTEVSTAVSLSRHCEGSPALSNTDEDDGLAGAGIEQGEGTAEATLSRVVSKEDFDAMEVIGQFNLGFIIARRKVQAPETGSRDTNDLHDDLFIIDQHASDEKYNFEKLQAETVIQSQRLLAPRVLNLPSHDEITAIEHLDVLRLNGYDVVVDEDADVGERVKLLAQPVSAKTVFDVADLEELLDLIGSRAGNEVVRPSKARKMFASRACRKSVMIGKALNAKQMTSIIRHMGGMDQPWACPHGRPTMRWLAGLGNVADPDSRSSLKTILSAFD